MARQKLVTKSWSCSTCYHSARVSTEREATADAAIALIVAAHDRAVGLDPVAVEMHSRDSPA